jgi:transcriptional regulator with XRE-family HTH domain
MLADNIKKFRKRLNLSQEELARKAGITYSTLIKLESGVNKNPTVKTLQQLAGALEVSLDQLVEGASPSK